MIDNRVENLISAISKLREFSYTQDDLKNVKNCINLIFNPNAECTNFIYTTNVDKLPFGCIVFPVLYDPDINNFLISGNSIKLSKVEVELDSKLFDYGLSDEQIAQVILFNIYHLTNTTNPCDRVREMIDDFFSKNVSQLIIRDSVQYNAILKMGLVDALSRVSSCLYLPDDVVNDAFLGSLGLDNFKEALDKIYLQFPDCQESIRRMPNLSMLEWALRLYSNVKQERIPAIHLLTKAKDLTASALYITKFNIAINALNRIDTDLFVNESVDELFLNDKRNNGLLSSDLKDLEDDLFEYRLRAKNSESIEDILYAIKQINIRLSVLENYIKENINDPEIDKWIAVKMQYIEIRDILNNKKTQRQNYSIFLNDDISNKE